MSDGKVATVVGRDTAPGARRAPRGQALVELALFASLLALMLLGALSVGQLLAADVAQRNIAREAALAAGSSAAQGIAQAAVAATAQAVARADGAPAGATVTVALVTDALSNALEQVTIAMPQRLPIVGRRVLAVSAAAPLVAPVQPPTPPAAPTSTPVPTPTDAPGSIARTDQMVQLEAPPTAVLPSATAVPSCDPTGGFGLHKLLQLDGSGSEDYVYTAGNVICPQFGVDSGKYYTLVVTNPAGTPTTIVPCTSASNASSVTNSYTVQPSDPLSNASPYTFALTQYTNSTCATVDKATQSKSFCVAAATIYADVGLTQQSSTFAAGATAYLVVSGIQPSLNNWIVSWIQPGSSTAACAISGGGNMPVSNSSGRLPFGNSTYLQYPPSSSATDNWNKTSVYSPSCPAFSSSNAGTWTLTLYQNNIRFVTLPVFTVSGSALPTPPATDLAGNGQVLAPGTGFFYTFHTEQNAPLSASWNLNPAPTSPVTICLYTDQPAQTPPSYAQEFAFSDTRAPQMQITNEITGGVTPIPLEGTTSYAPTDAGSELDDHYLDGSSAPTCTSGTTSPLTYPSTGTTANEEPGYYTAYFYNGSSANVTTDTRHNNGATVTYQAAIQDDAFTPHEQYVDDTAFEGHTLNHSNGTTANAWCDSLTTTASGPITVTWNIQASHASAVQLYLYPSSSVPAAVHTSGCGQLPLPASPYSSFTISLSGFTPATGAVASNANTTPVTLLVLAAGTQPAGTYYVLFYNPDTNGGHDANTQNAANDGAVITYEQ